MDVGTLLVRIATLLSFLFAVVAWVVSPSLEIALLFLVAPIILAIGYLLVGKNRPVEQPPELARIRYLRAQLEAINRVGDIPYFARSTGPGWNDFERGYVWRRTEVDDICERITRGPKHVVVFGAPASGKSVILRHVGYTLATQGRLQVSHLNIVPELGKIDLEAAKGVEGVLVLDDAHRNTGFVENLLQVASSARLLIGSRTINFGAAGGGTPFLRDAFQTGVFVSSEEAFDKIVDHCLRLFYPRGQEPELRSAFARLVPNLWHLGWALEACRRLEERGLKVVPDRIEEYVLERVRDWLYEDLPKAAGTDRVTEIMLVLSAFFRHEIQVRERFLLDLKAAGISNKDIECLVKLDEVVRERGLLSLHHSKLADLYLTALQGDDRLSPEARVITGPVNWEHELIMSYLVAYPGRVFEIMAACAREGDSAEIRKLLNNPRMRSVLRKGLGAEFPGITAGYGLSAMISAITEPGFETPKGLLPVIVNRLTELMAEGDAHGLWLAGSSIQSLGNRIPQRSLDQVLRQLVRLTYDRHPHVRRIAAETLSQFGDNLPVPWQNAVFDAILRLMKDSDSWVKVEATMAVGRIRHRIPAAKQEQVIEYLIALSQDSDRDARWRSVSYLCSFATYMSPMTLEIVVDRLLQLLNDPYVGVKLRVIASFRALKDRIPGEKAASVVESLFPLLHDLHPDVRSQSESTLRHLVELLPKSKRETALRKLVERSGT